MIVHWGQLLATVGTAAGIAVAGGTIWHPFGKRRDQRKLDALKTAATLAKVEMRETMTEIVTDAVDQVKTDVRSGFDEVKTDVQDVRKGLARQELDLARQFGGNGGGIRQALNEHGQQIAHIVGRLDQLTESGK